MKIENLNFSKVLDDFSVTPIKILIDIVGHKSLSINLVINHLIIYKANLPNYVVFCSCLISSTQTINHHKEINVENLSSQYTWILYLLVTYGRCYIRNTYTVIHLDSEIVNDLVVIGLPNTINHINLRTINVLLYDGVIHHLNQVHVYYIYLIDQPIL